MKKRTELRDFLFRRAEESEWRQVKVPHDWAISADFDVHNDPDYAEDGSLQHTGRSGGLPCSGVGYYQTELFIPEEESEHFVFLEFSGVMSQSEVTVNGIPVGGNHFGYLYFSLDITKAVKFGEKNRIEVKAEVLKMSSRWYSGGGIFRPVYLVFKKQSHIRYNGIRLDPRLEKNRNAVLSVSLRTHGDFEKCRVEVLDTEGNAVANGSSKQSAMNLKLRRPKLWTPESPYLYTAKISLIGKNQEVLDEEFVRFGVRSLEFTPDKGFFLNGEYRKFHGVCMHHDLGLLGAAFNRSAAKRQLEILKEMGADALRTTHNPPEPQLLDLCDEMGFLVIVEFFDEWVETKCVNGYHIYFKDHAKEDLTSVIRHNYNHPCIVMWSIGNEIPEQIEDDGWKLAEYLRGAVHEEDTYRPVTIGINRANYAVPNHFADHVDVVGFNYRCRSYDLYHRAHPEYCIYGSETESTLSSRGEYKLPVVYEHPAAKREDFTVTSYEVAVNKSTYTPDREFAYQRLLPNVMGQFTWTGFDYLGEPVPYEVEWPSRSSYFGIFDLCGFPKDRYWLFKGEWTKEPTLHLLPHWNWEGHEGEPIEVQCFTNFNEAELFLNGKSYGFRKKYYGFEHEMEQFRLIWKEIPYEPGEIKVVAYNRDGSIAMEERRVTAGTPEKLILTPEKPTLSPNPDEVLFVKVSAVDEKGVECPLACDEISFTAEGADIRGTDNGDQRELSSLTKPVRKLYNGLCIVALSANRTDGKMTLHADCKTIGTARLTLEIQ